MNESFKAYRYESINLYRYVIAGLVLAVLATGWLVVSGLFRTPPEDATPRTAAERLIMDAALSAKRSPNSIQARINLAKALATGGNYGEALAQVRAAEKLDAGNPELAMVKGSIYGRIGNTGEAIKWLKRAAADKEQLADFYAQVYTDMARAYEDAGQLGPALNAYDRVLKYAPVSASTYRSKAMIYEKKGSAEAALAAYETAYRFDSQDRTLKDAIARLNRELAAASGGRKGK